MNVGGGRHASAASTLGRAGKSGPSAPGGTSWAEPYALGRRASRIQASFSQGNLASKRIEASCAVARSGSWLIESGLGGWASWRWRRLRALRRPPMRPMVRHWSTVLWWYGVPNSRFMAPRFIDRVVQNLKRRVASRCTFTRSEGECTGAPPNRGRIGECTMRNLGSGDRLVVALQNGGEMDRGARGAHRAPVRRTRRHARARVTPFPCGLVSFMEGLAVRCRRTGQLAGSTTTIRDSL